MKNYYAIPELNTSIPELNTLLDQAAAVIKQFITTSAIYCFAVKSESAKTLNTFKQETTFATAKTHIFLLILTEETKTNATAELADLLAGTISNCKATLLLHKTTSLRQLTANQKGASTT